MSAQATLDIDNVAPLDQQEDLEDLELPKDWYFGATLWSTDWTAETIVSQLKRGNINLSPRYQRRQAWEPKRQSRFIESLVLGLPVPQIILAEDHSRRGSFIVIDGKQRLLSLRRFTASEEDADFRPLKLSGLDDRPDLNGASYLDLKTDERFRDDVNSFENQSIRTIVIRNWKDERYLHSVFLRINTGSVQLSPQELRQALHPGGFADFLDDISSTSKPLMQLLKLDEPDFRMRDVELLLRYYAYFYFAADYKGNFKAFLDSTVDYFNQRWDQAKDGLKNTYETFEASLDAVKTVFGEDRQMRKWDGKRYETRINRAVFDIMTIYLRDEKTRKLFIQHGKAIKEAFENLCVTDRDFLSSIEATTKSIAANQIRFRRWAETLSQVIGSRVAAAL